MADISKLNAVPLANIEKLDAVLAANIAKVNGLVFTTAGIPAPAAAYSVRLLDSALGVPTYTGAAMRVRRDTAGGAGDDDEADIAFDSGVISLDSAISNASAGVTATTLGQFLNVGTVAGTTYTNPDSLTVTASCLTDTWYDQSGNANDATQATQGKQPQIHDGTVNTDLITENGKPALQPFGNGDQFENASTGVTAQYAFGVVKTTNSLDSILLTGNSSTSIYVLAGVNGASFAPSDSSRVNNYYKNGSSYSPASADAVNDDTLNQTLYAIDMVGNAISDTIIGYPWSGSRCMYITQEIVIWNSDQSSNRTGIETNINGFFGIY